MKLLLVAFDAADSLALSGFAAQADEDFDVLQLQGAEVPPIGAWKAMLAALPEEPLSDAIDAAVARIAGAYTHVAFASSMRAKDLAPRVAALMDAAMITDVTAMLDTRTFRRAIVAGSMIANAGALSEPVVLTVRCSAFGKAEPRANGSVEGVGIAGEPRSQRISVHTGGGARPDLSQAKVIVTGGRPLRDATTFESVIGAFADGLGGAAGATRAAVDSGIAPNELQVGQTGKIVAPDLYIAAGVSGSTQHLAGIKDSKVIVAINKDPDAPIFEVADFGLVADLFEAIPALQDALRTLDRNA